MRVRTKLQEVVVGMSRQIIGAPKVEASRARATQSRSSGQVGLREPFLGKRLREKRSNSYLEAISRIDAGTYQSNRGALDALLQTISSEFPELGIDQVPLGIVSRCYLGSPFEVHICDFTAEIIEHFETCRLMSPPFESARSLALQPAYAFIEVYTDAIRAIAADGSVSVIGKGGD